MRKLTVLACFTACVFLNLGCRGIRLVPVKGVITVNGKPLDIGNVAFFPDESKGNTELHYPYGEIGPTGAYEMFTKGRRGVPPGWYKVVVTATRDKVSGRPPPDWQPEWLTHPRYTRPYTTNLRLEVIEDAPAGSYDLQLKK